MIYMLFDNPADEQKMEFLNGYETISIRQIYPKKKCNTVKQMATFCNKIIKQSTVGDTIICWYDFMAVLCWWLCKIQLQDRKIIALNILLKDKATVKNKLAKFLYRWALRSEKMQATVTSRQYGKQLNEMLGLHKRYFLLHDIYHRSYNISYRERILPDTVFCGGKNGRDWEFLIKIARTMPEVTFQCVMSKEKYEQLKDDVVSNMVIKSDISEKEFLEIMCQSQLVVMPLDTEAPAGLILFFQAAANCKMIITSNTLTTQEYFTECRDSLCEKSIQEWRKKILYYLRHPTQANACAKKIRYFLETECSEEKYAKMLWEIATK